MDDSIDSKFSSNSRLLEAFLVTCINGHYPHHLALPAPTYMNATSYISNSNILPILKKNETVSETSLPVHRKVSHEERQEQSTRQKGAPCFRTLHRCVRLDSGCRRKLPQGRKETGAFYSAFPLSWSSCFLKHFIIHSPSLHTTTGIIMGSDDHHHTKNNSNNFVRSSLTEHQKQAILLIFLSVVIFVACQLETTRNWMVPMPVNDEGPKPDTHIAMIALLGERNSGTRWTTE
jgi:hypothetical protein